MSDLINVVPWGLVDLSDSGSANIQMIPGNKRVEITDPSDDHTIYLPPVKQAAGHLYSIILTSNTGSKTITISVESADLALNPESRILSIGSGVRATSVDLDTAEDYIFTYCDGTRWIIINGETA